MNKEIIKYVINMNLTMYDALVLIEDNNHRCLIVVDNNYKVVGVLSDGDIRKALIQHRLISTPINQVMNINYIKLNCNDDNIIVKSKTYFKEKNIMLIPLVNNDNELVDVILAY